MLGYSACIVSAANAYHVPPAEIETVIKTRHGPTALGVMGIASAWLPTLARAGFKPEKVIWDTCSNIAAGAWILAANPKSVIAQDSPTENRVATERTLPGCAVRAAAEYHIRLSDVAYVLAAPHRSQQIGPMGIPEAWLPFLARNGFDPNQIRSDQCTGFIAGEWILGVEALQGEAAQTPIEERNVPTDTPPAWLFPIVLAASVKYSLPPELLFAVADIESGFKPWVTSHAGAEGLMQLMPQTAATYSVGQPYDATQNVMGGAAYLATLRVEFKGNLPLMIAAYNSGEQAVVGYGNRIPPFRETELYVPAVLSRFDYYRKHTHAAYSRRSDSLSTALQSQLHSAPIITLARYGGLLSSQPTLPHSNR